MEFLYYGICFIIAFYLGWRYRIGYEIYVYNKYLNGMKENNKTIVYFEIINDKIYVYEYETGNFLVHGNTYDGILAELSSRFPGKSFCTFDTEMDKLRVLKNGPL